MMFDLSPIAWLFFALAAMLYASVGHGGASSYLALMVWMGWPMEDLRPQALVLNMVVSLAGTLLFLKSGAFRGKLFLPLVAASIPLAWVGGNLRVPAPAYEALLAFGLVAAALRLAWQPRGRSTAEPHPGWLLLAGSLIGLISGMIGIGGGIFLTPLLIMTGWTNPKEAAALSAPFIFLNSGAGLLGVAQSGYAWEGLAWGLAPAVLAGGLLGAWWGSQRAGPRRLRHALSLVLIVASTKLIVT